MMMARKTLRLRPVAARVGPIAVVLLFLTAGVSGVRADASKDARKDSQAQVEFGILAAQKELWREALYRWKRAVEVDPTYAAAYNNLALTLERRNQKQNAIALLERARKMDPNNADVNANLKRMKAG